MTAKWLAESLDEAFIRLGIRPTLPTVSSSSRLTRLLRAETQTQADLADDRLFPRPIFPDVHAARSHASRSGLLCVSRDWAAHEVPLESDWGFASLEPRRVCTEWYTRPARRPLLLALSGWMPIQTLTARVLWPLELIDRAGLDIVIPLLPTRSASRRYALKVDFPSVDPSHNVLEVATSVGAIRQTIMVARELGYRKIVVWGASLGAYIAALLGTIAPVEFEALILEKPLVRLSDALRLHGRGSDAARQSVAHRLDRVYRAVSPLDRQPRVDSTRVHVLGALFDRVTTCVGAERLASHFDASYTAVRASHLYDPGRAKRIVQYLLRITNGTEQI
jgi:pimeloyl-ACP methyl ester carboxylesterase